jgi:hypothetical protein
LREIRSKAYAAAYSRDKKTGLLGQRMTVGARGIFRISTS